MGETGLLEALVKKAERFFYRQRSSIWIGSCSLQFGRPY